MCLCFIIFKITVQSYCISTYNHFLCLQFLHKVILVRREDENWKVKYQNVVTKEVFEEEFDFVIVGNGHFSKPRMPNIPGESLFKGV